jgi:ubiquitin C-terminal hydrolase
MKKIGVLLLFCSSVYSMQQEIPLGIRNLGNTCYMNAALQCLYQVRPLTEFMLSLNTQKNDYYQPDSVGQAYMQLMHEIQKKPSVIVPQKFCQLITENIFYNTFIGQQEDAQQFIVGLLDRLADYDIRDEKKPKRAPAGTSKLSQQLTAVGQIVSCFVKDTLVEIGGSRRQRSKIEIQNTFDIPILAQGTQAKFTDKAAMDAYFKINPATLYTKLTQSLEAYCGRRLLNGNNKWEVDNGEYVDAEAHYTIMRLAPAVILSLNRFVSVGTEPEKISNPISFPLEGLDFAPYFDKAADPADTMHTLYDLTGFVLQSGSAGSGHYTAFVKASNGQWYYCDDSSITPKTLAEMQEVARKGVYNSFTPYVFFYKRREVVPSVQPAQAAPVTLADLKQLQERVSQLESRLTALSARI